MLLITAHGHTHIQYGKMLRKLSHTPKAVACKKLTHCVTFKTLLTFLNATISSLSGSNCAHYL